MFPNKLNMKSVKCWTSMFYMEECVMQLCDNRQIDIWYNSKAIILVMLQSALIPDIQGCSTQTVFHNQSGLSRCLLDQGSVTIGAHVRTLEVFLTLWIWLVTTGRVVQYPSEAPISAVPTVHLGTGHSTCL